MDSFLTGVDQYCSDTKITKLNYYIEDEDESHTATYYIENGLSSEFNVRVDYELNNDGEIRTDYARFPKEINNTFIVDGDYRISTSVLVKDNEVRFKTETVAGRDLTFVTFDYNRKYITNTQTLIITNLDQFIEGSVIKRKDITIDEIDDILKTEEGKKLLKLSKRQSLKLQIKLNLDFAPEYIDGKLLSACNGVEDDRKFDYVVDKSIRTSVQLMMDFMMKDNNRENFRKTKRAMTTYFTRYKKLQLSYLTNLAHRFVKKGSAEIQIPPGINPINLDGFKSKIQISEFVAYNNTLSDLIDIADTPINNNTNLQNSITVSTHITDEGVNFDVYDKKFKKIQIEYLDYLNSKVVASEYVDYDNNELKPINGEVEVKYRMKRMMVPVKEIDYIDLHPDYRLSSTARRIPFVNYTDSVRVSMGSSMLRQSITLVDPDKPLVDTGNNEELAENVMTERYTGTTGKVIDITDDEVIIKDNASDNPIKFKKHSVIKSINNVGLFSSVKVKVGDKVKNGDIIISAVGIEPDTARTGINAKVLFHAYKGLTNEDAVVVSESYSRKMAHYSIIDVDVNIRANSKINWILTPGTRVKSKDILVKIVKTGRLNEVNSALREKLGGLLTDETGNPLNTYVIDSSVVVPNNITNAVVSDVLIKKNNPKIPRSSRDNEKTQIFAKDNEELVKDYEEKYDRSDVLAEFPDYIARDRLQDFETDKKDLRLTYVIKVRLIVMNELKVGDKLTNRYGGKGVISRIIPDDEMPRVNGEPVGIILNPYSIIGRKILISKGVSL